MFRYFGLVLFFGLCFGVPTGAGGGLHPIHLSLLEVELKREGGIYRLEMALKVFADDVHEALYAGLPAVVGGELGTEGEAAEVQPRLEAYLAERLRLRDGGGRRLRHRLVGREMERGDFFALWLYLEVEVEVLEPPLELVQDLLLESFPNQQNLVFFRVSPNRDWERHVAYRGQSKLRLTWPRF